MATIHTNDATIEARGDRRVLRFERHLNHPVERVWAALTEPAELIGWLAQAEIEPRVGGAVTLRWLNSDEDGNQAVAHGTITEFDPPRLLEYDTEPHGVLRMELAPDGDGTRLIFTVSTTATRDDLRRAAAGWHIHLEHLESALAGEPIHWPTWAEDHFARWQELERRYVRDL